MKKDAYACYAHVTLAMLTVVVFAPHVTVGIQDFCVRLDQGMDWRKTVDHLVINMMSTCLQDLLYLQYYLSRVTPMHICKSFSLKMKFIFALVVAESLQKITVILTLCI